MLGEDLFRSSSGSKVQVKRIGRRRGEKKLQNPNRSNLTLADQFGFLRRLAGLSPQIWFFYSGKKQPSAGVAIDFGAGDLQHCSGGDNSCNCVEILA